MRRVNTALLLTTWALFAVPTPCIGGDLREIPRTLRRDEIHDWLGRDALSGRSAPSSFELTDDERALRDLAYPLIEAPYNRQKWYSAAGEYGFIGADHRAGFADHTAYTTYLLTEPRRSPSSRYGHLIDDIRNDTERLPQFFETAARVMDIDGKRHKAFAYIPSLSDVERREAVRRMKENAAIVSFVPASLVHRVASYKFALERLVIMVPSPQAVDAEQVLAQLKGTIARYRNGAPIVRGPERSLVNQR